MTTTEDAGRAGTPCEGDYVDLAIALTDARCWMPDEDSATNARADFEERQKPPVTMSATVADNRVSLRVQNPGSVPLVLPLFVQDPLFKVSVLSGGKSLLLAPADPVLPGPLAASSSRTFFRIVVLPGGTASITLDLSPEIVAWERETCPPEAKCGEHLVAKGKLPEGKYETAIDLPIYGTRRVTAHFMWEPSARRALPAARRALPAARRALPATKP